MFDISLAELFLIVVVAVIFIGPKELPQVIRTISKVMRGITSITNEIRKTWNDIADTPEIKMIRGDDGKWYESYPNFITSDLSAEALAKGEAEKSFPNTKNPATTLYPARDKEL